MNKIEICKRIEFCAGHRLLQHEGKCSRLHGHNFVAEIYVSSFDLDSIGRVIDFSVIKEKVGGWINDNWDHNFIFNEEDPLAKLYKNKNTPSSVIEDYFAGKEPYLVPYNPTMENLSMCLFWVTKSLIGNLVIVEKVRLWESDSSFAEYKLGN